VRIVVQSSWTATVSTAARVPRVVFGATSYDVATYGFEDLQLYREMGLSAEERSVQEDTAEGELRQVAAAVLRA
jgi:guanine deaminase